MILTQLDLSNFRNYQRLHLKLSPSINIFIGNNAQGKTNILESIYVLAITKSHRLGIENNLVKNGKEFAKIKGSVKDNHIIKDLEVDFFKNKKRVLLNQNEIRRISSYITNLNVIIFTPDDLDMIKGSPFIRRNFLNVEISQISQFYIQFLNEYNKILKNRNEYLKSLYVNSIADFNYLNILTEQLIDRAVQIYLLRRKFINQINEKISDIYYHITGIKGLKIQYDNNIEVSSYHADEIRSCFKHQLQSHIKREMAQGTTLYGPHRDDFSFYLGDENLKFFGSQGQQRLAIIAFKLAEIDIFREETGTSPILLLDDIFSEIDRKKKNRLLKYIEKDIQTIITTTDLKDIQSKILQDAKIFEVRGGMVTERVEN